jgi:hypothetical protein
MAECGHCGVCGSLAQCFRKPRFLLARDVIQRVLAVRFTKEPKRMKAKNKWCVAYPKGETRWANWKEKWQL